MNTAKMALEMSHHYHEMNLIDSHRIIQDGFDQIIFQAAKEGKTEAIATWEDFGITHNDNCASCFAAEDLMDELIDNGYEIGFLYDNHSQAAGLIICWGEDKEVALGRLSDEYRCN